MLSFVKNGDVELFVEVYDVVSRLIRLNRFMLLLRSVVVILRRNGILLLLSKLTGFQHLKPKQIYFVFSCHVEGVHFEDVGFGAGYFEVLSMRLLYPIDSAARDSCSCLRNLLC